VSDTETFEILTLGDLPILLKELHQSSTYSGLLEGLPTHEMNEELLERHARGRIGPTHVVRPKERRVSRGGTRRTGEGYPPGMLLPRYCCEGRFRSHGFDEAWIVWFQDSWALPIDPAVLKELRKFDFLSIAESDDTY